MQVFKFGGASVKDAESVRNSAKIISKYKGEALLVVISAMGKTTNLLEKLTREYYNNTGLQFQTLKKPKHFIFKFFRTYFLEVNILYSMKLPTVSSRSNGFWKRIRRDSYDYLFDQIVSMGELISTKIVAAYVALLGRK
jgi:aspartate kinase